MTRRNKSTIKAVVTALAMVLAFVMSSTAYASATLTKIRVGQTHDKTRVVFDIKHNHRFVISTLKNPSRIVVDFYKTKNKISFDRKSFQDPRLGRIRIKDQKQRVRIVLDLRNNFDYHYFTLGKNKQGAERVVVDVLKKSNSKHIVKKATPKKTIKVAKAKAPVKKVAHKVARNDIANEQNTRHVMNAGSPVFHPEKQDLVIAIDPGHGGKDTGAIGHNHLYEKNVVLKMAKKLKKYIDAQPGMRAVLTRDRDIFIPLHKRVRLAHKMNADIFISIHA
ncbi:MAG: N-acetylmuramoyl-L-alanine amidase, partial [Hydrogenovibrio sp.]|nr:N-acetylmuramoyl-L-alanine amidase [Hydrogenovibrio sp.]